MILDDVRDLYQETILQRSSAPRHGRRLGEFDTSARAANRLCGDRCQVFVRRSAAGTVAAVGFEARGCAISIASADLMAEAVHGLDRNAVRAMSDAVAACVRNGQAPLPAGLRALSGLHAYPSRIKCAMLPWQALVAALDGKEESDDE